MAESLVIETAGLAKRFGARLVGTWSQRSLSLPLTFARDAK